MRFKYNMDTIKNQPLHFGAKFIKNVNIQKYNPKTHLYRDAKTSLVEFEPDNYSDMMAKITSVRIC